jgi:hypothetical protein
MNKRGFGLFLGMMLCITFIVLALAFAPALHQVTDEARNNEALNCSTTTDNEIKADCTAIDSMQIFIIIILGLAVGVIGGALN